MIQVLELALLDNIFGGTNAELLKEYSVELKGPFNYSARDEAGLPRDWYENFPSSLQSEFFFTQLFCSFYEPLYYCSHFIGMTYQTRMYRTSWVETLKMNSYLWYIIINLTSCNMPVIVWTMYMRFFFFISKILVSLIFQVYDRLASVISMECKNSSLHGPSEWGVIHHHPVFL